MPFVVFKQKDKLFLYVFTNPPTFLERKVGKRTSHRLHLFIFAKLLKFQETFLEKFLVSGFGADSPNIQRSHKKARRRRAFIFSQTVGTAVRGPCFKGLFEKSPLKIRTHLSFGERCAKELCSKNTSLFWRSF